MITVFMSSLLLHSVIFIPDCSLNIDIHVCVAVNYSLNLLNSHKLSLVKHVL